jgi:hypothetical protein
MSEQQSNPISRRGFLQTGVAATAASTGPIAGNATAQADRAKEQWGGGKPSVLVIPQRRTTK